MSRAPPPRNPRDALECEVTYARDSGALLAFGNAHLVGIARVPKHGAGWSNSLPSNGAATGLAGGDAVFLEVAICGAGLTPFRIRHDRRNSWPS